jgi:hypothetical protein
MAKDKKFMEKVNEKPLSSIDLDISKILEKQSEILERLNEKKSKDTWDKLSVLAPIFSGLLIAFVGAYFTYIYDSQGRKQEERLNELQARLFEIQIEDKEIERIEPLLDKMASDNPEERKLAIMKLTTLYPERTDLAVRLLELTEPSRGAKNAARIIESVEE